MNINKFRDDTPGTKKVIHFNNAGASLMPRTVSESVINYLREESLYGGYETAHKNRESIEQTYSAIGNFIHAQPNEIALLENATAAWNMAFFSIDFKKGDRILTSKAEYASNYLAYLRLKEKVDIQIEVIANDEYGQTSVTSLEKMMGENVKLISITHIPTNSGLVNPVEKIGEVAQKYDCFYLVDACQSVGQYPVDVQNIGCDMLSTTGRKYLRGPRGTGFLYVKKNKIENLLPPFIDLHAAEWISEKEYEIRSDARRFENWEMNYAGIMGLKKAVQYASDIGINRIWKRLTNLAEKLRWELAKLPKITVHDIGEIKGGIVTFTVDSESADDVQNYLSNKGINVSTTSKKSTLLDMEERNLSHLVRASVHYYNTETEIDKFIDTVKKIANK
ncbi:aminotransferase class V-fold PLP-dependent enzyme [Fodinibius sp.]|uniref:aminotransferase class V-fold PLP-dependent enzyme n=1 Tax=Fodinibius sp. TaxID=1872440 RepID=UPI002ACE7904|nr:aminotransferase class V-fold PLP-dependent enzyme [Fodinibius sp.]MDZ7659826.1 aminotransferase class V-fold PLP-dependent enzyme [Fodinibius sp.]